MWSRTTDTWGNGKFPFYQFLCYININTLLWSRTKCVKMGFHQWFSVFFCFFDNFSKNWFMPLNKVPLISNWWQPISCPSRMFTFRKWWGATLNPTQRWRWGGRPTIFMSCSISGQTPTDAHDIIYLITLSFHRCFHSQIACKSMMQMVVTNNNLSHLFM